MYRRTKRDPLPKEGRIDLKASISPKEYAEIRMYQELECPSMIELMNKLLRNYIRHRRKYYKDLGMLEPMLNRLK